MNNFDISGLNLTTLTTIHDRTTHVSDNASVADVANFYINTQEGEVKFAGLDVEEAEGYAKMAGFEIVSPTTEAEVIIRFSSWYKYNTKFNGYHHTFDITETMKKRIAVA